ncbi:DUF6773 family protein [Bacillus swezeyi]|uniref:DUF3278 domain-containing protein n=1 Tax=Bacillus swezeyi TaxID=1925020 RepID=A0A5M8S1E2_9BACI|nr:DUF6773 family protein [Bacillus swezeyi]KAA6453538.1 hypothetical protein DX927_04935 [Bacillus swezeyi]KAA6475861.1 hypothetical protein DX928_07095 [Bacillus swezeyi]TYS38909.1 hypothetical protein FZC77_04805 [Bacillus swezeyi]
MKKFFKSGDEYIEKKMEQFFSEAGMIVAALLLIDFLIRSLILERPSSEYLISGIGFAVYVGWIGFRYLFSGLEYPEIANKLTYRKKRKEIIAVSLASGIIFFILTLIFSGVPEQPDEWFDSIVMFILFVFFYFIIHFISLHQSFKKNKDLLDD